MDVALVAFIGSGLTLWSSGVDPDIPDRLFTEGVDVVRGLAQHGNRADVERLVSEVVGEIWQEWRNARRERRALVLHLEQLPPLVARHRPSPDAVTAAIIESCRVRRAGGSADLVAHRLASDVILRARMAGELAAHELDETMCLFLLSRLLTSLLSRHDTLMVMRPAFDATCGRAVKAESSLEAAAAIGTLTAFQADPHPAGESIRPLAASLHAVATDKAAAVAFVSEAYSVSVAAIEQIAGRMASPGCGTHFAAELEEKASQLAELTARIAAAPPHASLKAAGEALERGALSEIDSLLADGETAACMSSPSPLDDTATEETSFDAVLKDFSQPLAWRIMRAQVADLASEWLSAARHFAFARTLASTGARHLCGPILLRQGGALVSQGLHHDDEKALIEAAQVFAEAGGFLCEEKSPLEWAQAHVDLGHLMLVLGERESRPERFLAAALHFKPAVDVFSRHHDLDRWAYAQIGLAQALKRTGEFQGDVVTLGDAAFAFRAALGQLTKDRAPQDWADAQLGLGQTLVRIAEETGEAAALEKAVPALKAALAQPRDRAPLFDVTAAEAALGRAYASLDAHQQDDVMLQDAISLLESALASGSRTLAPSEHAVIEQVRGTALWSLGERRTSLRLLEDAMRAKLNAVELLEQLGEVSAAGRLREDLDDLALAIERMTSRAPRGVLSTAHDAARSA